MIPILYESTETAFTSNGLGGLPDTLSCLVTEERNGIFELEMQYPVTGLHYDLIQVGRILYVPHDDTKIRQPFDIYRVSRVMNGTVTINARHISYRLAKIPVEPFSAGSCSAAFLGLEEHAVVTCPFTFWTDKSVAASFTVSVPATIRSLLGGTNGSILDTFGTGEYEWDMWNVKFYLHRGSDNGVTIRYGKNMTDLTDDTDSGSTYTGIYPYWYSDQDGLVTLPEKVVYADEHDDRVVVVDATQSINAKPTEAQLRAWAETYITSHAGKVSNSIKISFVQLWQTEEYKNVASLQRVKLCDTVTVIHPVLGVETKTNVVKVVYDAIRERYSSMTLSEPKTSLTDIIQDQINIETESFAQKSFVSSAIAAATLLIQGGYGGHVVIGSNSDGWPEEILIMDTEDRNTAVNVIRMNMGGIGFSRNGYAGPFETAWTVDGHFYANWIDAGTLTANIIKLGTLTDKYGRFFLDLDEGVFRFNANAGTVDGTAIATATDIDSTVSMINALRDGDVAANETHINEILQWITFDAQNGLQIGSDETGYSVRIKDSEIGFYNGTQRMAYISNKKLFIEDVQIQKSLQFGISSPEWAFVPRVNGNLSFRYIGA